MKRWIAMLLTVCMLISLCPVGVFAEPATGATGVEPAAAPENKEEPTPAPEGAENPPAAPAPEGNGNAPAENGGENAPAPEGNGNVPADNGGATGATGEQNPQPEQKTCTCTELCAQDAPNHNCEVCKGGDLTGCCRSKASTLDDPEPLPDEQPVEAEPEEPVCTCTTRCTEGNVDQTCEACLKDFSKCHVSETQPVVDTYEFYVDDECLVDWTQNLQEGETLSVPGNPTKDGAVFQRWYKLDDAQNRITVESGAVSGVSGKTVRVDAEFAEFSYVLFMSADGNAVVHTAQGSNGNAVDASDRKAAAERVNLSLDPTQAVVGWSTTPGAAADEAISFAAGTVKVYPVIKNGYWVIFDSKGGDYVAPIFAQDGQTVTLPTTATRSGYTFDGWYQGEQRVERVSAEATLEAHWIAAANTKYTVIHWQENANDDGYSFKESETKTGKTGEQTAATAKNYSKEGFTVQAIKQQTIAGDGSTIVNVYYKRNVYTITFHVYTCGKAEHTHGLGCILGCGQQSHKHTNACRGKDIIIKAKHGANISEKWPTVNGSCTWSVNEKFTDGPWQTNIDTMPIGGANFYGPLIASSTVYAYYYVEALPGTSGQAYILHHTDSSAHDGGQLVVTDEDKYPITGFTYKSGPQNGESYINAKFYYTRNSYSIVFINNGIKQKTEYLKYEQSLNGVGYTPERPANVPAGYEFAGWYDNEAGEGNAFVFDGKTMPAQNITLYAKWKAPEISATVYLTVEIDGVKETLSVPYGSSLKNAPGYEALMQKVWENNDGKVPSAWFSVDGDGAKTLFNPDTKLYGDVTLVPHFSGTVDTFKVTYVEENNQPGPVDSNDYQSGSPATVLSPVHSNMRFLYWKDEANGENGKIYKPGESMKMTGNVILTAYYTEAPARVALVYHDGEKTNAVDGIRSNDFIKVKSAADVGFTAPNGYTFAGWSTTQGGKAEYFAGNTFFVPKDGADLYAVWTKRTDLGLTVLYQEEGTGENLENPVIYYGKTFEEKIPVAQYKKDITGYTWVSTTPEDTLTIGVGSNVITLYYKRNTHQVSYRYTGTVPTGAPEAPATTTEKVESAVKVANTPEFAGYVFSGWTAEDVTVDANGFFTMPNHDVTFTGSWSKRTDLSYTVVYKWNNQVIDTVVHPGQTFGDEVTVTPTAPQDYTLKRDESKRITIAADESANVIVFELYKNVTLQANSGNETYDGELKLVDGYTANDPAAVFEGITAHGEGRDAGRYDVEFGGNTIGTVSKDDNYIVDECLKGTLVIAPVSDEITVTITEHSKTETYDGKEKTVTGYDVSVDNELYKEAYIGFSGNATVKGTEVGEYPMELKASDFTNTNSNFTNVKFVIVDGGLKINPVSDEITVTITEHSKTETYDGKEKTVTGYDVSVDNELYKEAYIGFSGNATVKGTEVGEYPMELKASDFTNTNSNFTNVKFVIVDGGLKINPSEVEITVVIKGNTNTVTYAGIEQTVSGYTVESIDNTLYAATDFIYTGIAEASGVGVGIYNMGLKAENFKNTNGNFENVVFEIVEDGKLTITPAPLTVTTDSDSKVYDGTALTAPGSITGLVGRESVTFTVTGSQTNVGSSTNTYSIDWGNTKSSNYTVAETLGTLTVTAQSITPPVNPDDPNGYLGVQVDSPADHVYDGAEHKWAPTVTDKDGKPLTENEDYTVSYGKTDFTNVTGDITVTVQGIGNYTGTVTRSYKITPREAVITVNNGTKTAGRNDPAFTGTVTGLIGENDLGVVSYVRTNNAEAVGTYADVLTALYTENANYDVRVINGTFVITAANNPNPNPPQPNPNPPQPNPNPPQPQPQPEPEPEVKPEAGPEVTPEEPQPAAPDAGPVEEIVDEETPLAMGGAWALVNLILTVLTVLGSILLLIGYIGKKQKEREDENGNVILNAEGEAETDDIKKKGGWRLASIIPAVAAVIAFILTENMRLPMVLVDKWTLLMVIIALVQLLVAYFSKKKTQEPEQPEQMVANA